MESPLVSVIFITYKRIDLLKKTYESFKANTDYPRTSLELILCDDGSSKNIRQQMQALEFDKYLFSDKNKGMAANVNKGILESSGEYILQIQDDWLCRGPNDYLHLGIKALQENNELGLIRYRLGISYPRYKVKAFNGGMNKLNILDWEQGDDSINLFIYSDNPHLKKIDLHKELGTYKNYKKMYETEVEFCERFNHSKLFKVAYIDQFDEVFEHIGDDNSLRRNYKLEKLKYILSKNYFTSRIYATFKSFKRNK